MEGPKCRRSFLIYGDNEPVSYIAHLETQPCLQKEVVDAVVCTEKL